MDQEKVDIWCDGSYRGQHNRMGAGFVIVHPGMDPVKRSVPLPELEDSYPYGSQIAEFLAAALALEYVREPSRILLRTDSTVMRKSLTQGAPAFRAPRDAPSLMPAFQRALEAAGRHRLEIVLVSDKRNEQMKQANSLAQTASTPPKRKPR